MAPRNERLDQDVDAKQRAMYTVAPAPPKEFSRLDQDVAAKQQLAAPSDNHSAPGAYSATSPGAFAAPPGELSQLDRRIASKQGSTRQLLSADPGMQAKEQEKQLRKEAINQSSRNLAAAQLPAPSSPQKMPPSQSVPGAYSLAERQSSSQHIQNTDSGMQAKEREKQLRKEAINQSSRNLVAAKLSPLMSPQKTPPSQLVPGAYLLAERQSSSRHIQNTDAGMQAKEQEKQLRKEAINQSSRNLAVAKLPPPSSPQKMPPAQSVPGAYSVAERQSSSQQTENADTGMQAKEREKQLRKEAINQSSRNLALGKAPPPSPPRKSPPANAVPGAHSFAERQTSSQHVQNTDAGMQAKERERQLRKEAINQSSRSLALAKTPPPSPPKKKAPPAMAAQQDGSSSPGSSCLTPGAYNVATKQSPPRQLRGADTGMQAKEREKQLRKEAIGQSTRNLALGKTPSASPPTKKPPPPISSQQGSPSPASPYAALAAKQTSVRKLPGLDTAMQAKEREKQLRKEAINQSSRSLAVANFAPPSPPSGKIPPAARTVVQTDGLSSSDSNSSISHSSEAKLPPPSPPPRKNATASQPDSDLAAKQRAAPPVASYAAPGAYSAPSGDLSQLDQRIAAKHGLAPALASLPAPGAHAAPPSELAQLDQRIASKQGMAAAPTPPVPAVATPGERTQSDQHTASVQEVTSPGTALLVPGAYSAPPGELSQLDQRIAAKISPTAVGNHGSGCENSSRTAEDDVPRGGSATNVSDPLGCSVVSRASLKEGIYVEKDLEAPLSRSERVPEQAVVTTARSYGLTQHPQQDEESMPFNYPDLSPAASAESEGGLNLVEATLVVEEMVEATVATPMEFHQDEVMKIREQSAEETARIKMWRILVSLALLATAIAVTTSTYKLLVQREDENFRNVYYQFATTVADAAVEQQANIRDSLFSLETNVATMAEAAGATWPYFIVPHWESLAKGFKSTSNAEFIAIQNFVTHEQRGPYVDDFITPRYEDFIKEAHMEAYGHLDFLDTNTSYYQPFIAQKLPNKTFVPDIDREFYFARTTQSPPARKYGPTINNNLIANKVIGDGFAAVMAMHNESVFTPIKPFTNVPPEEHAKMHSNGAEGANNPHSFTFHPVHRQPGNQSSDIVAMFACATAWDFSMLNLLPDNVKGMYCLVENTCNQTVTYRIDGGNASYLGEGELQPTEYSDMAVEVDLSLQVHPNVSTTPGHCMYSMRIYPSRDFEEDYKTSTPAIYAAVVAGTFVLIAGMLFIYDLTVTKRNEKMIYQAAKTNAILSKFVPDHLRDRIMGFNNSGGGSGGDVKASVGKQDNLMDASIMDISKIAGEVDRSMAKSRMDASSRVVGSHARRG